MNDDSRRKWEAFVRMQQFGTENAADFPIGSVGNAQFTILGNIIESVDDSAADQLDAIGDVAQQVEVKDNAAKSFAPKCRR